MIKIIVQKKTSQIILIAVCAFMFLLTIFLITLSFMFSGGKNANDVFGKNLYLVKTDAFELITAPSAVIGEKVVFATLAAGDIVIFKSETGNMSIGEIVEKGSAEADAVYFLITDEAGNKNTVAQADIISKAVQTSRVLGVIIAFVTSPSGVLVIAVVPCIALVLFEGERPALRKKHDEQR